MRRRVLTLIALAAVLAGCGSSGPSAPQEQPQAVAAEFLRSLLEGYPEDASNQLGGDAISLQSDLPSFSIQLQTLHYRIEGQPRKKGDLYFFTLRGRRDGKPVRSVWEVKVTKEPEGWRVIGFRPIPHQALSGAGAATGGSSKRAAERRSATPSAS